jgi:hypothetical protein
MTLADAIPATLRALMGDAKGRAILANFTAEDRVDPDSSLAFADAIADATELRDLQAACRALVRKLPCDDPGAAETRSNRWYHHVDDKRFRKYGLVDTGVVVGARPFQVPPAYFEHAPGEPRSLWISPFTDASPDVVVARLGLAHFRKEWSMLRLEIEPIDDLVALFIPTVFDSDAAWQWRRPPAGHTDPWGMTLNLDTCAAGEPELIAVAPPVARLAQPLGRPAADQSTRCLAGGGP